MGTENTTSMTIGLLCVGLLVSACGDDKPKPTTPYEVGVQNECETEVDCGIVDCGTSLCEPCQFGAICQADQDCQSGVCTDGICEAACDSDPPPQQDHCATGTRCELASGWACIDTETSLEHCGDCGLSCTHHLGLRADSCAEGTCLCSAAGEPCGEHQRCTAAGCVPLVLCGEHGPDCGAHGVCVETGDGAECACLPAYQGEHCEHCADGYQDHDQDGLCSPTCESSGIQCEDWQLCDASSGLAQCKCDPDLQDATPGFLALQPLADATIRADAPDETDGQSDTLTLSEPSTHSLLDFGFHAVCPNLQRIDYAFLTIDPNTCDGWALRNLLFHEVLAPWEEEGVSWRSQPATRPIDAKRILVHSQEGFGVTFDLTSSVRLWNSAPDTAWGLKLTLKEDIEDGPRSCLLDSRESGGSPPTLLILANSNKQQMPLTADTFISKSSPSTNYGTSEELIYRKLPYTRMLLHFDLGPHIVPTNIPILRAEVVLKVIGGYLLNTTHAYLITEGWSETEVTWDNQPVAEGIPFGRAMDIDTWQIEAIRWDVTEAVERWRSGDAPNHGILIRDERELNSGASRTMRFGSREHSDTSLRPVLVLYLGSQESN